MVWILLCTKEGVCTREGTREGVVRNTHIHDTSRRDFPHVRLRESGIFEHFEVGDFAAYNRDINIAVASHTCLPDNVSACGDA